MKQNQDWMKCSIMWGELFWTSCVMLLFFAGGMIAVFRNGNSVGVIPYFVILLSGCVFTISFLMLRKLTSIFTKDYFKKNKTRVTYIILILSISIVLRIPQIGTIVRNDSSVYYSQLSQTCRDFEFSLEYFIENFRLAGHPSYGFCLLAAIPEFFFSGKFNNIWLCQTLLSTLSIFCVFDILSALPRISQKKAAIGALIFGCSPMFLGLNTYFQLDFGTAVFIIFVLWAYFKRRFILLTFCSLLLVFSKEFGIGLLVGFFLGVFVYYFVAIAKGTFSQRIKSLFGQPRLITLFFLCGILGLTILYYLFGSSLAWVDVTAIASDREHSALGYIGFDINYTWYKFKQIFCVDFGWLQVAIILVCLCVSHFRSNSHISKDAFAMLAGMLGAGVLYFTLSTLLVTYTIPRYNLVIYIMMSFALSIAMAYTLPDRGVFYGSFVVSVLFSVQAYVTIDPVMLRMYPILRYSLYPIVYSDYTESGYIGDYAIYNYQYTYLDRCIAGILADVKYDDQTDILIFGEELGYLLGGAGNDILWDSEDKTWTMDQNQRSLYLTPIYFYYDSLIEMYESNALKEKMVLLDCGYKNFDESEMLRYLEVFYTDIQGCEYIISPYGKVVYYTANLR